MWLVNFEDGTSVSSKQIFWDKLPKEKRITGVQLSHPHLPKLYICLTDYDRYYFTQEAVAFYGASNGTVVAEVIGGHDLKLGVGIEVRLEYTGNITIKTYPVSRFKYSQSILYEGKGTRKPPKSEVVTDAPQVPLQV